MCFSLLPTAISLLNYVRQQNKKYFLPAGKKHPSLAGPLLPASRDGFKEKMFQDLE